jgi:hypothetical protein
MSLLAYVEPVGAALSIAKSLLRPDRAPEPRPAPQIDFRTELTQRLNAAERAAENTLKQFDANGDGYLSRSELALSREAFARLDANADGRIDIAELTRAQVRQQEL